jgi:hypothetical protein
MRILQFLRDHLMPILGTSLFLILALVIIWSAQKEPEGQGFVITELPPLPSYPSAQDLSQATAEPDKKFRVCGANGEEFDFNVRVTRFMTTDSLDSIQKFYYKALVEDGPYRKDTRGGNRFTETFEYETKSKRADMSLDNCYGFGVVVQTTSGYKRTNIAILEYQNVAILEYQYEKIPRSCHPYNYYNNPWKI